MPATFGIAAVSIAGKARSYGTRLSLFPLAQMAVSQSNRLSTKKFRRKCHDGNTMRREKNPARR